MTNRKIALSAALGRALAPKLGDLEVYSRNQAIGLTELEFVSAATGSDSVAEVLWRRERRELFWNSGRRWANIMGAHP